MQKLRQWREFRALTQEELAERAGISSRSVASYEGGAGARPGTVRALAAALNVDVSALLEEPEAPKDFGRSSETERPPVLLEGTLGGKGAFSGDLLVGIDAVFEDLISDLKPEEQDRLKIESAQKKVHELVSQSAS